MRAGHAALLGILAVVAAKRDGFTPNPAVPSAHEKYNVSSTPSWCVRLVIIKGPDSGSTWFVDELNTAMLGVRVTKEPFTKIRYPAWLNASGLRAQLADMLLRTHGPRMALVGFSQNPELKIISRLGIELNFLAELQTYQPNVRFVTWVRSNVVSRAFSAMRKSAVCQQANLRGRTSASHEVARCQSATYTVEHRRLQEWLEYMACSNSRLEQVWGKGLEAYQVTYEEFSTNKTGVLVRLFRFLGLPANAGVLVRNRTNPTVKRSPTNISAGITNAGEVRSWLEAWAAATSPEEPIRAMFSDTSYTAFPLIHSHAICALLRNNATAAGRPPMLTPPLS